MNYELKDEIKKLEEEIKKCENDIEYIKYYREYVEIYLRQIASNIRYEYYYNDIFIDMNETMIQYINPIEYKQIFEIYNKYFKSYDYKNNLYESLFSNDSEICEWEIRHCIDNINKIIEYKKEI